MSVVMHLDEKIFPYALAPIRINDEGSDRFEVWVDATIPDMETQDVLDLCERRGLRVGLRVFTGDSKSAPMAEYRAVEVAGGDGPRKIRIRFEVPRDLFAEQQCRLVQIDMLYENKVWFAEIVGPPAFVPMWIEKPPRELDVFEYYLKKHKIR